MRPHGGKNSPSPVRFRKSAEADIPHPGVQPGGTTVHERPGPATEGIRLDSRLTGEPGEGCVHRPAAALPRREIRLPAANVRRPDGAGNHPAPAGRQAPEPGERAVRPSSLQKKTLYI